jgi:iron-sulfur cluster repair protein YtfE (RIC family)
MERKDNMNNDSHAPVTHFSNGHEDLLSQLMRLGDLPQLLGPAAQARQIADQSLAFFSTGMYTHHTEEEKDLFPAVRASAKPGAERMQVDALIGQLTQDHRHLEELWEALEKGLRKVAKGQNTAFDVDTLQALKQRYQEHARLEEQVFLPLAHEILGRNDNHMAALGLSLHMRHLPHVVAHI